MVQYRSSVWRDGSGQFIGIDRACKEEQAHNIMHMTVLKSENSIDREEGDIKQLTLLPSNRTQSQTGFLALWVLGGHNWQRI